MRTLIFDGSPRRKGDTAALIAAFAENLSGEYTVIRAYECRHISPCIDCRGCWKHPGCVIRDGMQEVYGLIAESDCIVIASPIYYSGLTGPLLSLLSRLQAVYCAKRFQGVSLIEKPKTGVILLAGGGNGGPDPAVQTAKMLLAAMNAQGILPPIMSLNTDQIPAKGDASALLAAREAGRLLSKE
ncbi:MAG: flavodoxin family protein [Clostridiales bacterium]|nr:flavodoxin family protein [Clostridiales bacterium]